MCLGAVGVAVGASVSARGGRGRREVVVNRVVWLVVRDCMGFVSKGVGQSRGVLVGPFRVRE